MPTGEAKARVLVVDDDPAIQELLRYQLTRAGLQPTVATGGEQGWSLLEGNPEGYEAVLLDRTMPGIDGMEVLARIRDDERLQGLPVILQTGLNAPDQILEGLEAGAYYYLTKPFDQKALLAIVRTAVADCRGFRRLRAETRRTNGSFALMQHGVYAFRTLDDARTLAILTAQCSREPERIVLGLSELLINAVEHGNLGISYDDKTSLLDREAWASEVDRRLALPENRDKKAVLEIERFQAELRFRIRDDGDGFDWRNYVELSPERAFDSHGRGIALSRKLSFDRVEYLGAGNEVIAVKCEAAAA